MSRKLIHFLSIIAVFIIFGAVVYFWQSSGPGENEVKPATNSSSSEEKDTKDTPKPHIDAALQQILADWAADQPGSYGIYVREIDGTMRAASYNANEQFVAASTYKLFVSYAALRGIEQGDFTLQTRTSDGRTVAACIEAMLVRSDNDCGWPVGALVGWDTIDQLMQTEGFTATQINNYTANGNFIDADKLTSATDLSDFLYRLQSGKLLDPDHTDLMLTHMKQQIWDERIEAGVPANVSVAAKPGWLAGIENDAAIVYGPNSTYIVSILSNGASAVALAKLSEIIYDHLQR